MVLSARETAAAAFSQQCAVEVKASLEALKRDVARSFRICNRDFSVLGGELLHALAAKQERERMAALALDHERSARRRAQAKAVEIHGHIRVMCRVRPPPLDVTSPDGLCHTNDTVLSASSPSQQDIHVCALTDGAAAKSFSFDRVFHDDTTQQQVYKDVVLPLVVSAVDGQQACVFAYGQTGAGKTHSIHGHESDRGMVFRAAETIFELIQEQQQLFDFNVTVQMVEIYNEEMYDLLGAEDDGSSSNNSTAPNAVMVMPFQMNVANGHGPSFVSRRPVGEIRHGERGIYLRNVEAIAAHCPQDIVAAAHNGEVNRTVHNSSSSGGGDHSSRSHCVMMVDIARCSRVDGQIDGGRLVFVDLAGSERLIRSEIAGPQLREAQHINKSLAAVGDVLAALLAKDKHVPFRNSKLTHLLQESLGATDGQTVMLVHVSPASSDVSETINTLKFASRVNHLQQPRSTSKRSERQEMNRLHSMITSQAAQLQVLQDKLASELELRRKYEKRLEEYRQDDHRRRSREGTPCKPPPPQAASPQQEQHQHQQAITSTPERPSTKRRWSLYSRKESFKAPTGGSGFAARMQSTGGQENIAENILRSRPMSRSPVVRKLPPVCPDKSKPPPANVAVLSTPVRRARRLSLMMHGSEHKQPMRSPVGKHAGMKRKPATPAQVRSILKRRRLSVDPHADAVGGPCDEMPSVSVDATGSKQVSFDLTSHGVACAPRVGGVQLLAPPACPPMAISSLSSLKPPRQPTSMMRTRMNASRVPARVRAAPLTLHAPLAGLSSPAGRVRSPGKALRNGGWRK